MAAAAYDVVVVGGGLSGLAAGTALASSGLRVAILEAADRVGGRTLAAPLACCPTTTVDAGGQWLGSKQAAALALAARLGVPLVPQHVAGKRLLQVGPTVHPYEGLIPSLSLAQLLDAQVVIALTKLLGCLLWLLPSWAPGRRRLEAWADATTVHALAARVMCTAGGRALLRIVVQALFGAEPAAISVLAFTRYVGASGSLEEMTETGAGSLQAFVMVGGAQQLSTRLASELAGAGGALLTGRRVTSVRLGGGHVALTCSDGTRVACNRVVVAVPPPLACAIEFAPPLPPHRRALMERSAMGAIVKAHVVYASAFWRAGGFSGEVIADVASDPDGGPAFNVFDGCVAVPSGPGGAAPVVMDAETGRPAQVEWVPPPPHAPGAAQQQAPHGYLYLPCLVVFINGDKAREVGGEGPDAVARRRDAVLRQLARWFGPPATRPLEYRDTDWGANPFTRGCPIASYGAGVLGAFGLQRALAEPEWADPRTGAHALFWAGTETSTVSTGFMDGALLAGQRAADDVVRSLRAGRGGGSASEGGEGGAVAGAGASTGAGAAAAPVLGRPLLSDDA